MTQLGGENVLFYLCSWEGRVPSQPRREGVWTDAGLLFLRRSEFTAPVLGDRCMFTTVVWRKTRIQLCGKKSCGANFIPLCHPPCCFVPRGFMLDLDLHWLMQTKSCKLKRGSQRTVRALRFGKGVDVFEGSAER